MRKLNLDKLKDKEHIDVSTEDALKEFDKDELEFAEFLTTHKKEINDIIKKNLITINTEELNEEWEWDDKDFLKAINKCMSKHKNLLNKLGKNDELENDK